MNWWVDGLSKSGMVKQATADAFRHALVNELTNRYTGHWYAQDQLRASGYRSISYDHRIDPTLVKTALACGIENIDEVLASLRGRIMFINPGQVKVVNTALQSEENFELIFSAPVNRFAVLSSQTPTASNSQYPSFPAATFGVQRT